MTSLQVAVWGLGHHAVRNILPALRASPGLNLLGVCSRREASVADASAAFGCTRWATPEAMLADRAVDVVYVSTPIGLHAAHGLAVLGAGKHLWCEKPLAETGAQAAALIERSRAAGVTLAEGFMYLYHPQFAYVLEAMRSGRLGHVHSVALRFGIPALEHPGFRLDPALGGGAFLDVGCYPISAAGALFPVAVPRVVFAEIDRPAHAPVDQAGRAVLRYEGDLTVLLEWGTDRAYRNEIDVWGRDGALRSERIFSKPADYVPQFRFLDRHGKASCEPGLAGNHFVAMFDAFRNLVAEPGAAEDERARIAHRSRLIDLVRQHSTR